MYDVRTGYFGFGFGSLDMDSYIVRELAGKSSGQISLGDLRGAAHARWRGMDEQGGNFHQPGDQDPPQPGNWQRTANGWDETYWDWNGDFQNPNVSIEASESSILLSNVQIGPRDSNPTSIGINGYFKANANKNYSFIIRWACRTKAGHDYAANGRPLPAVAAGFAGFANGYQDPPGEYWAYPDGNPADTSYNYRENPAVNQVVTWQGSFTARSTYVDIVPYFNITQGGIGIGESATFDVEVLEHRIWQTN